MTERDREFQYYNALKREAAQMRARGLRVLGQEKKQSEGPHSVETRRGEAAQMHARGLRVRDQDKTRPQEPHGAEIPSRRCTLRLASWYYC